jgi:hypothetical protein
MVEHGNLSRWLWLSHEPSSCLQRLDWYNDLTAGGVSVMVAVTAHQYLTAVEVTVVVAVFVCPGLTVVAVAVTLSANRRPLAVVTAEP